MAVEFLAIPWLDSKNLPFHIAGSLHFPGSQKDVHGPGVLEHVEKMKQDLLSKVKALGKELPLNTLDELINHFGGPEYVAEVCHIMVAWRWAQQLNLLFVSLTTRGCCNASPWRD